LTKLAAVSIAALVVALAGAAHADDSAASPAARALYEEATKAMDRKDFAVACPKLEEVVRQVPEGVGARITLGECYEGEGRLASAWNAYNDAAALAVKTGQTARARKAHDAAEALHGRLGRLTIEVSVAVAALPGLTIERDGVVIDRKAFNTGVPVDRGQHEVTARATGRTTVEKGTDASDGVESKITIDDLPVASADAPALPPKEEGAPPPHEAPPPKSSTSPLVYVGFGIGGAGLALGAITGAITLSSSSSCKSARICTQGTIDGTKTTAWISDVGFAVGVVGVGLGVVGLVTSKKAPASARLRVGPGSALVEGSF
jgi:hypothetical protein